MTLFDTSAREQLGVPQPFLGLERGDASVPLERPRARPGLVGLETPSPARRFPPRSNWVLLKEGGAHFEGFEPCQSGLSFRWRVGQTRERRWELDADALELLALGASNAVIAGQLRVSEATVSRRVPSILRKVGCPRASLPVVARVLRILSSERWGLRSAQVRFRGPSDWTESEREVASLSLQGFDLCEIAAHRRASTSTVRTQLRIAARKAHCVDRYEIGVSELVRLDVVGR